MKKDNPGRMRGTGEVKLEDLHKLIGPELAIQEILSLARGHLANVRTLTDQEAAILKALSPPVTRLTMVDLHAALVTQGLASSGAESDVRRTLAAMVRRGLVKSIIGRGGGYETA